MSGLRHLPLLCKLDQETKRKTTEKIAKGADESSKAMDLVSFVHLFIFIIAVINLHFIKIRNDRLGIIYWLFASTP